jgi:hypothetical protein
MKSRFLVVGILMFCIVILTVNVQSMLAALSNRINALCKE